MNQFGKLALCNQPQQRSESHNTLSVSCDWQFAADVSLSGTDAPVNNNL